MPAEIMHDLNSKLVTHSRCQTSTKAWYGSYCLWRRTNSYEWPTTQWL